MLLFAGGPTREYQFVRNMLRRSEMAKSGDMIVDVLLQSASDGVSQDANAILAEFPHTMQELAQYDTIIAFDDLRSEQLLSRNYCEHSGRVGKSLREHGVAVDRSHEIASERDLIELLEADIGVAVIPHTASLPDTLKRTAVDGLDSRRTVHLYGVAGRQRTAVASAVMRLLRGADWQQFLSRSA